MDRWWLIIAGFGVLLAVLATYRWTARRWARAGRRRQRRARRGERQAERLLRRAGFDILERQATAHWSLEVDGYDVPCQSRADLLVTRGRRSFVAEIKTGDVAPDPAHPPTRRQLLEYRLAFDVDGVILVDMEQRSVHEVRFPGF